MKKFIIPGLISCTILFLSSCTCRSLDCFSSDYTFQFDIVRAADSADLVFGRDRVYNKNEFSFYALTGGDTTFYELSSSGNGLNAPEDSVMRVWFYPATDTAFMRFSSTDIDTMVMHFETRQTKCCGTITEISNFRLNDKINLPGGEGTQLITK